MLHPAVVLDAALPVAEALARLHDLGPGRIAVVRRQAGLHVSFHAFEVAALRARLGGCPGSLDSALQLALQPALPTLQHRELAGPGGRDFQGLVLDGVTVVGIARPRRVRPVPVESATIPQPPLSAPTRTPFDLFRNRKEQSTTRGASTAVPAAEAVRAPAPSPAPTAAAAPAVAPAPILFRAFPRLDLAREVVAPGERFELAIGFAPERRADVSGTLVTTELEPGTRDVEFDIQLVADGFDAPAGWYFRLRVPVERPEAAHLQVPLVAPPGDAIRLSLLEVHFSRGGIPCGVAFRKIAVQPNAGAAGVTPLRTNPHVGNAESWLRSESEDTLTMDAAIDPAPDLSITISKPDGNEATGRYHWTFRSPHAVPLPDAPIATDLGADARTFAGRMIRLVTRAEGTPLIDQALLGIGRQVRDKAPAELDAILRAVWNAVHPRTGRAPTVLLLSAEPHVPWELALLEDPPDATLPPFLGAQFAVGRWILGSRGVRVPPAREVVVRSMIVVAGDYRSSLNLRPLPKAVEEGEALERRWGAVRFSATVERMDQLLEASIDGGASGQGGAEAVHFACHGEVDPRTPEDATIFLDDDWPLDASLFLDAPLGKRHQPFLFLNACQVGQAGEVLGDYAGFAGNCLRGGFRGFLAPLWSVNDEIAHQVALEFYERAFADADGVPVAEIVRSIRGRYPVAAKIPSSTWLAYVFYGNPAFVLRRAQEA